MTQCHRQAILEEAGRMISGPRAEQYGSAKDSFKTIAELWAVWVQARFGVHISFEPEDVAMMNIMIKQARLANDVTYEDGYIDIAGYAALGGEIGTGE